MLDLRDKKLIKRRVRNHPPLYFLRGYEGVVSLFILMSFLQKSKMSFPKCLIGNPVFVKSMAYGCPTEAFGHDKVTKR